jgi:hypothetical protein
MRMNLIPRGGLAVRRLFLSRFFAHKKSLLEEEFEKKRMRR